LTFGLETFQQLVPGIIRWHPYPSLIAPTSFPAGNEYWFCSQPVVGYRAVVRSQPRVSSNSGATAFGGNTMTWRIGIAAALSCALLAGCASSGNESIADASAQTVSEQLVKGRTTQAQVRELYGDPLKTSFTDSGNESWEYEFSRMRSKPINFVPYVNVIYSGAEGDKKSLVIFFNKSKVVQQYTISTSRVDVSRGLITR
jgi:outer membrane protein assembly factor BamE (lipoprotein component of BamABCDE complex)